jgi:hypothetical protein
MNWPDTLFETVPVTKTGFTKEEINELVLFCLSDEYPRSVTVPRTGTTFKLNNEIGAALLYKKLKGRTATAIFGTEVYKKAKKRRRWTWNVYSR